MSERRYCELLVRQEEGKSRGPVAALNRMVTIPGELNMEHLKLHLMSGRRYCELLVRQEEEKSRGPVAALNIMVTIPGN
jgi:hypothetical protein